MLFNMVLGISASLFFKCTACFQKKQSELEVVLLGYLKSVQHENSENICNEVEL